MLVGIACRAAAATANTAAVTHEAARNVQVDAIVTRNLSDFKKSLIPVHPPGELLSLIVAKGEQE